MKVYYFTGEWCGPCRVLKPIAKEVSLETGIPIDFVDVQQNRALADAMQVTNIPTLIGVDNVGTVVFRHTGMTSKSALSAMFKKM